MQLTGIHHLTAVSADAPGNLRFYTQVMGMRLIKKTVNQDDVSAYHLFYGDGVASPGSDLTFFDFSTGPERRGNHTITRTGLRVAGHDTLQWWQARLEGRRAKVGEIGERDGRFTLDFEDPEGQRLSLIDDGGAGEAHPWGQSPVPAEHQIRGLGPITMSVPDCARPTRVLRERDGRCGMCAIDPAPESDRDIVHVYEMGEGGPAAELHVAVRPKLAAAQPGAGGVHHVAFRTPDAANTATGPTACANCAFRTAARSIATISAVAVFPRAERHAVRDRHRRTGLRSGRADGNAR